MPDGLEASREAEKDYSFTKNLVTSVYDIRKRDETKEKKRSVAANLFVGDWVKEESDGDEVLVSFHGGKGFMQKEAVGDERLLEICFIDVGQGDSILIETPESRRILIDAGKGADAYGFLQWKYNLEKHYKDFDALIISHGDADHAEGLIPILNDKHIIVKSVYHNGIVMRRQGDALGKSEEVGGENMLKESVDDLTSYESHLGDLSDEYRDWVEAVVVAKNNTLNAGFDFNCVRVDHLTEPVVVGEKDPVTINFVNPINHGDRSNPLLRRWSANGVTINANSVGVLLEYRKARILLCGDMNKGAENQFIEEWKDKSPQAHIFKAHHHGSHEFSNSFLKRVQPWISVISSGDDPDYAHPRANLLGSLGKFSSPMIEQPLIFSTELAATFHIVDPTPQPDEPQLYEKTIQGVIYVRTNGKWLAAGRVYEKSERVPRRWEWEKYALDLTYGKTLGNDMKI